MMQRFAALVVALVFVMTGISWSQIIPPQTLTKKRIVIQNIEKCKGERTTLVGRGAFDPDKQIHPKYVCRKRHIVMENPH